MWVKSIQDIAKRFKQNSDGYAREYRVLLILMMLAALADGASTVYFMLQAGPEAESHPAIRLVSTLLGPLLGPIVGKLCQLITVVALTIYLRRWATYIFVTVIVLYIWAAWYNVWGCESH